MANILFLAHRLPYPPNKGDKVRSYHLLKHLAARHRVFLGTFIDDPADEAYVATVRELCADAFIARLDARLAKLRSLTGLIVGEALTLPFYRHPGMYTWVSRTLRDQRIGAAVIFSSAMAQYVEPTRELPAIVDFVDVDSAKWQQYASEHRWPFSWLYRREAERLLAFERATAAVATRSFFVTEQESALFRRLAPEVAGKVDVMCNGVDADYFAPANGGASPFPENTLPIVFTGAMDYWPNIDAVTWFVRESLPRIHERHRNACFWIVGRNPDPSVRALEGPGVRVTGTVEDVRPYLQHASAVVAPLRVARGVQNKVLEAMAMARPVVASTACADALEAVVGDHLLTAASAGDFAAQIVRLLDNPVWRAALGAAARTRVLSRYGWEAHMSVIDGYLPTAPSPVAARNSGSTLACRLG